MPKTILIVHQNFPGQFPHIAAGLVARGDRVFAIGDQGARAISGVTLQRWSNNRGSTPGLYPAATRAEADLLRAEAAAHVAIDLRAEGIRPDIIIGHPGWGETLHLRDVFPHAKLLLLGEYYYQASGGDLDFDPDYPTDPMANAIRVNGKNATQTLALVQADRIICPTPYQASTYPPGIQPLIRVVHEGIDPIRAQFRPGAHILLPDGRRLDARVPVITFVNRTFERLRGFPVLMRALPRVLSEIPEAHVLMIGRESGATYGGTAPEGGWRAAMAQEMGDRIDWTRVHFLGAVSHSILIDAFSISAAHVYYTYPFVLSWSLLEAMACQCMVIGSDTAPVRDAIVDGYNGLLNPFFDIEALSSSLIAAIRAPRSLVGLRLAARKTVLERFDRQTVGVPAWLSEIDALLA